jgi:hypothetical protein
MNFRITLLTGAILVCIALQLHAQSGDTYSVAGIVSDSVSGESVIGATVMLRTDTANTSKNIVRGSVANKFGFYSLTNVKPGDYILAVRAVGYRSVAIPITLGGNDESRRLNIQLAPQDVRGQEVVVEANRSNVGAATVSTVELDPGFIQQLPAFGGEVDIFLALQLLPGVKVVSEISIGLYVRGGSPDQNLILLDGVIVYNPSHLGGFLSTFNSDAIRDIKLIKGAFPAEYGGRLSSVLDMTMREGTKEKISGSAGISLINSRLTVEGPITDNASFMLSGRRMYLDLVLLAAVDPDQAPRYYFYDFNGKVNYRLGENDRIFASGYFGRDVFSGPPAEESNEIGIDWGNATGNLRWMHIVSPELFTNFSAIFTDYQFSTEFSDKDQEGRVRSGFKSISGIRDYMLRAEAQYHPHEDHNIKAGIEVTEHRFRADVTAEIADFPKIERDPSIINALDASVYLQDEWNITPLLIANVGARFYYFQRGDYLRVEPRVSLAYTLQDNLKLKGAFAMGNQFLHMIVRNDIALPTDVWFPSTATVKPSEAMQGVLGIETTLFDNEYLLTVEGYYKKMKNLLEYKDTSVISLDVPLESSFTSGEGEAYGVEVFLNKRVGSFTGWIGYTLAWTQRQFEELNRGRPFYPRYDRRHDVSVVLTYQLGESWEFGATWVYGTGQAYTMPTGQYQYVPIEDNSQDPFGPGSFSVRNDYTERNGYRIPAFHKLDLNFTYKYEWFKLPWQFSINIYNAYNHKNVFAQYVDSEYADDGNGNNTERKVMKQFTLFPLIPTFGIGFKF